MLDKLICLNNCIRIPTHDYFLLAVIMFILALALAKLVLIGFCLYELKKIIRCIGFNVVDDHRETRLAEE